MSNKLHLPIFRSEIENCLTNLSYPSKTNEVTVKPSPSSAESKTEAIIAVANKEKFEAMFRKFARHLLKIETTDSSKTDNALIQILIQPLEKRFKFHFCTARKTNNLEKVGIFTVSLIIHFIVNSLF